MERLADLRGYPKLATLRKLRVEVESPRGIQKAVALERLDITLGETSLYEIERVKTLVHLTVRGAIDSIYGIRKLRNLRELFVYSSADYFSLLESRSLERLDFTTTPLNQLPWMQTPKLTHLRIRGTALTELFGLDRTKSLRQIELDAQRIQTVESETDAHLRKLGKQRTLVDGKRRMDYATFAATKQIVTY